MARNGSGVYTLPAGSTITNGDVSDSSDLNTPLSDLETDMNTPRPVVAGGTGVSSVAAAQAAFKIPPFDGAATISGAWTVSGAWTITGNQTFNDNVALRFGTGIDTTILHNGTNTIITDASTGLIANTASFKVRNAAGTEDMIEAVQDSFVKLRFNNTARLTTTVTGVDVTGDLEADSFSGAGISTNIVTDTGSTTKVPHVSAVEAYASKKPVFSGPVATTSGASVDLSTAISSGVRRVTVLLRGVSTNGAGELRIRLGNGSFITTGYVSAAWANNTSIASSTDAFTLTANAAAGSTFSGEVRLTHVGSNNWVLASNLAAAAGSISVAAGQVTLSSALDRVQMQLSTGAFDLGEAAIMWEF